MKTNSILFVAPLAEDFNELYNVTDTDKYEIDRNGHKVKKFAFYMPMGAVALSSWVKKITPGIKTSILDCNNYIYKQIKECKITKTDTFESLFNELLLDWQKQNCKPDIISITLNTTTEYNNFFIIVNCLKEVFPGVTIIAGGVTASYVYKDIFMRTNNIDAICIGEGEIPFEVLLTSGETYQITFEKCSAFVTKNKPTDQVKPIRVENLDVLPPYDFSFLKNIDLYFDNVYSMHITTLKKVHDVYLSSSRGCVFNCYFCNTKAICGKGIRYYSENWVLSTIDNVCTQLKDTNFNCITFIDELLFLKFDRAKLFFNYCKQKGIYSFTGNDSFITASQDVVDLVKETGPGYVSLPLESGSPRVLKEIIRKPFDFKKVPQIIEMYRNAGLIVRVGVMIGLPGETKKDIEEEIAYYKTLHIDWLGISFATPFPGSDLYNDCVKNNYLTCNDISEIRLKKAVIQTENFSTEYLQDILYFINLEINFKHNYNIRVGNYERAILMMEEVLKSVPEHAFAFYFIAECYEKIGKAKDADLYKNKYINLINQSEFWYNWSKRMDLNLYAREGQY